jgi:hypothetical protein
MISDVLFDALEQIHAYQRNFPGVYDDLEKEINLVVAGMDWLRHRLDQCPEESTTAITEEQGGHGLSTSDQSDADVDGRSDPDRAVCETLKTDQPAL